MLGIHVNGITHHHQITIVVCVKMRDQDRIQTIEWHMELEIRENTAAAVNQNLLFIYRQQISRCRLSGARITATATKDRNFGNARYVRNIFEKAIQCQANRLASTKNASSEDLTLLRLEDIKRAFGR